MKSDRILWLEEANDALRARVSELRAAHDEKSRMVEKLMKDNHTRRAEMKEGDRRLVDYEVALADENMQLRNRLLRERELNANRIEGLVNANKKLLAMIPIDQRAGLFVNGGFAGE